ncbi:uncharacterized protein LOC122074382 [Macadamia integrifolia]|uniref:uncharacterized protein LOC122074382 n=1 Tax=Macadamia integrifolia TaxID=60698 RepID=UPI001C4FED2B|nr:uncharacterized protein LOC122074382 [Macadamia integrifolia]
MDPSRSSLSSSGITTEELRWFHWIDREIFTRLVITLGRDIEESVRIIALWQWMEEMGFQNIIIKLLSLPDIVLNFTANEAVRLLNSLEGRRGINDTSNAEEEVAFTRRLLNSTLISLSYVFENRVSAVQVISKFITDLATRVFGDIIQMAMNRRAQFLNSSSVNGFNIWTNSTSPHPGSSFDSSIDIGLRLAGLQIGVENRTVSQQPDVRGKQITMGPGPSGSEPQIPALPRPFFNNSQYFVGGPSSTSSAPQPHNPLPVVASDDATGVPPDDRTIFVTFSRGYPILKRELQTFFTMIYGDCIESIHMQDVVYGQPMFARVVLRTVAVLDLILEEADEEGKAKFVINGKHAWVRKYIPKNINNR